MSDTQRNRLEQFIAKNKLKLKPWAKDAGISDATIRSYLKGRTNSLTHSTLERLAKAAGVTVDDLISPPRSQKGTNTEQVVSVKHLEVTASAGGGFEVSNEPEGTPYPFSKIWLEANFGGHDGKLRIIHIRGDSMLPTIHDGDICLVLTGITLEDFTPGNIYVLWDGRGLIVKRIDTVVSSHPRLRIISDNQTLYAPYEIDASEARIIGRVLWRAGNI